jgi:hypothetical protein
VYGILSFSATWLLLIYQAMSKKYPWYFAGIEVLHRKASWFWGEVGSSVGMNG